MQQEKHTASKKLRLTPTSSSMGEHNSFLPEKRLGLEMICRSRLSMAEEQDIAGIV